MSTATVVDAAPAAKGGGKKKLIMLIAIALVVVVAGGAAAMLLLKKKSAAADGEVAEGDEPVAVAKAAKKADPKQPPVFVPLDHFTVNLADREAERYAQVGITLEIDGAETGEQIKLYLPAIRNNILMAIADRQAAELMGRDGKAALAAQVKREAARAMGYELPPEDRPEAAAAEGDETPKPKKPAKPKAKKAEPELPIKAVHFSTFIIQ